MKPLDSDEDEEQLAVYQKTLRERANRSIQQLSSALAARSPDGEETGAVRSPLSFMVVAARGRVEEAWLGFACEPIVERRGILNEAKQLLFSTYDNIKGEELMERVQRVQAAHGERQYGEAWTRTRTKEEDQGGTVNQLRSLLEKQQKEAHSPLSPSKKKSSPKRTQEEGMSIQDLIPMIYNQSEYIQHLEAQVKFCTEELEGMKQRVRVVVVENEKLQSDLKNTTLAQMVNECPATNLAHNPTEALTWQDKLEQLKVMHQAQTETLESQVVSLRKELSVSQKECEEVKDRLRRREVQAAEAAKAGSVPRVAGLCLKCAQHEAVLAGTHTNVHVQAIERLTKERDELMAALCAGRVSQQESQQREWSACLQVKQAVEMAEEFKLQKTRVEVQCEQLSRELARQREHVEREAKALKERVAKAREEGRTTARKEKEELAQSVTGLSQRVAELEGQLDRADRDKSSLTNQLDDTLRRLTNQEQDGTKALVDLRYQMSQAQLKRDEAERELRDLGTKTARLREQAAQEVERLNLELIGCRQHLEAVQKDGSQWQSEAVSLAEQLANTQRQLHLTRQEKENAERAHEEDVAAVTQSARESEGQLTHRLEREEEEHQQRVEEMEGLLSSQNSLIRKLKEECCMLGGKLEDHTERSRSEREVLSLEKHHLEETVERLKARCSDMEEQCVQHGRMHQRMKDRLQQLDRHCQTSAQQVCELLAKQNQLMQDRNTLTEEMQNLRIELPVGTRQADVRST